MTPTASPGVLLLAKREVPHANQMEQAHSHCRPGRTGDSTGSLRVSAVAESTKNRGRFARVTYLTSEAEDSILSRTSVSVIPGFLSLKLLYVLMFWGAAAAFVWLGLVEYMQRELEISDANLIRAPYRQMDRATFSGTRR